jgi:hypothetical protein
VFGSVYSGGGFTLGAGYRVFTGDRTSLGVSGLYSLKSYKLIEFAALSPGHLDERLDFGARVGWRDATQVAYHGIGMDTPSDQPAAYRFNQLYATGAVTVRPHPWLRFIGGMGYESYKLKDPTGNFLSVDEVFTPATAPGLGVDPKYIRTRVSAAFDSREPGAGYARRGGNYEIAHHGYHDRDSTYSFNRLDLEAIHHIPILRENWVLSLRGRLESVYDDADVVPYFLLPSLGSGSTLRAYSSWRFRDRHSALTSAEWRWIVNRLALDMALFVDAGMVAPRFDAISLGEFVGDYGIGIRLHGPAATPLRIELAKGREGMRLVFAGSAAF